MTEIYNKPTAQGVDSHFIVNTKENSELTNSTILNENIKLNSNISSDTHRSSSNEYVPQIKPMLIVLKKKTILNSAPANEKSNSSSSITSENSPAICGNTPVINCADFNVNGNTIKHSVEILDNIRPPLSHNITTPILVKRGQSNTELQALKYCFETLKLK